MSPIVEPGLGRLSQDAALKQSEQSVQTAAIYVLVRWW